MRSIIQYQKKGYDIEVWIKENNNIPSYAVDINYPCGERVSSYDHFVSKENALNFATNEINKLPIAYHEGCADEYCKNKGSLMDLLREDEIKQRIQNLRGS